MFGSGLKKDNDVDVFGGLGYLRGVWEKVRNGSNCGFGWFRSGLKRSPVIGGIYWRWKLLSGSWRLGGV